MIAAMPKQTIKASSIFSPPAFSLSVFAPSYCRTALFLTRRKLHKGCPLFNAKRSGAPKRPLLPGMRFLLFILKVFCFQNSKYRFNSLDFSVSCMYNESIFAYGE